MTNVMKSAWEIAYEGVKKFGGEVKEYFAEALKIAWDLFKKGEEKMHSVYLVSHNNGNSEIVIAVKHITKEVISSSFSNVVDKTIDCNKIEITGVKLNGSGVFRKLKSKAGFMDHSQHGLMLRLYNVEIGGKYHEQALVKISQNVKDEVYAPYNEKKKELEAKRVTPVKSSYDSQVCLKCHSICHGDCTTN